MGTGHLVRCGAVAEAWLSVGGRVTILADETGRDLSPFVPPGAELETVEAGHASTADRLVEASADDDVDWVLLDGYEFGPDLETAVAAEGIGLLVVDDADATHDHADLVLRPGLRPADGFGPCDLVGLEYTPLRAAVSRPAHDRQAPSAPLLGVILGGDPSPAVVELAADVVDLVGSDVVVVGIDAPRGRTTDSGRSVRWIGSTGSPFGALAGADVVLAAAGSTAWELCHLGIPSVLVAVAANQIPNGRALAATDACVYLGPLESVSAEQAAAAVNELRADAGRREAIAARAAGLVDGRGAQRVVGAMLRRSLRLERAGEEHSRLVHEWANDPAVRSAGFAPAPIEWSDHQRWMTTQLGDVSSDFWIVHVGRCPVGQVRTTPDGDGMEVHFSVDRQFRGFGLAPAVLNLVCARVAADRGGETAIRGVVRCGNRSSARTFERAGFADVARGRRAGHDFVVYERRAG